MSEKRIGTLIYDPSMGRYDIRFGEGKGCMDSGSD